MNINLDEIAGFDAAAEEIRYVYEERDILRDEVSYLRKFHEDICRELGAPAGLRGEAAIEKARGMKEFNDDIIHDVSNLCKQLCEAVDIDPECGENGAEKLIAEVKRLRESVDTAEQFKTDICDAIVISKNAHNDTIIKALKADLSEAKRLRESVNKQEEFTEEAADILGVHPGDLTLSDILEALRKLKREEKLDDMNSSIIADLRTELDQSQKAFRGEHSRRLAAEKYISDTFQRAAKELDLGRIPDGIDALCDEIADLRNYRNRISCPKEFWEAICDIMEMDACDAVPSDVVGMTRETKQRLISLLALNPDTATWTDIYVDIEAQHKDHCDLIAESFKMKNELECLREALDKENEDFNEALRKTDEEALRQMRESYISIIKQIGGGDSPEDENLAWYEHRIVELYADLKKSSEEKLSSMSIRQSHVFRTVCSHLGLGWWDSTLSDVTAAIDDLKTLEDNVENGNLVMVKQLEHDKKFLEGELEHTDERRRHWVRRYKEEHEKAVNLDALYRKYKTLYDADAPKRKKLSDDLETYRSSYEAVKNVATKNRSLMDTVSQIVGTVGMHDDVTMAGVLNVKKKANHWDILVDAYGEGTIRSLLDNIGIDVSGDKGNGLFK